MERGFAVMLILKRNEIQMEHGFAVVLIPEHSKTQMALGHAAKYSLTSRSEQCR